MNIFIQESFFNKTERYVDDNTRIYETFTSNKGKLYKSLQKEYGRCTGKVYIDTREGKTLAVGWIFEGKAKYKDSKESYVRETWVTLHKSLPAKSVTYNYETV